MSARAPRWQLQCAASSPPLFNRFFPEIARWLPFQALQALFLSEEAMAGVPEGMVTPLEASVALPVFLGYVAVVAVAAIVLMRVRDV